jgi:hypothetical protein
VHARIIFTMLARSITKQMSDLTLYSIPRIGQYLNLSNGTISHYIKSGRKKLRMFSFSYNDFTFKELYEICYNKMIKL